jgi:tetratricopeptide (TPR) repeat protein
MFVMQPWIQTWLDQSPDFFAAIRLAIAKEPHTSILLTIGGGLLFTMVADIGTAWLGTAGTPARQLQGGFSLEKGGPAANHLERGQAYLSSGDAGRAIESFSKALRLNPGYAGALIGRAFKSTEEAT